MIAPRVVSVVLRTARFETSTSRALTWNMEDLSPVPRALGDCRDPAESRLTFGDESADVLGGGRDVVDQPDALPCPERKCLYVAWWLASGSSEE